MSLTISSIRFLTKYPYLIVGWFWYLVTLIPVIDIVQTGAQSIADRYVYTPLIGLFIVFSWGIHDLTKKT